MHKLVQTLFIYFSMLSLFIFPSVQAHEQEVAYCQANPDGTDADCFNMGDRKRINRNFKGMLERGWQLQSVVINSATDFHYFYFTREGADR